MVYKAKFIGTTSCGFSTGEIYEISILPGLNYKYDVRDIRGKGYCPLEIDESILSEALHNTVDLIASWIELDEEEL